MTYFNTLDDVKERIDKNYQFIKTLEQLAIGIEDENERLEVISLIGKIHAQLVTGQYSSALMENEIIEIGKKINFQRNTAPKKNHVLHVMSRAYAVGGHTRIVNNWIKWDEERTSSIVFTEMTYFEVPDFLKERVRESGGRIYCLQGDYISKAEDLLDLSQDYERVVLHIHMHDIVPVLAYSNINWDTPVYFYNHADFRFSYGFSVSDVVLNLNEFDDRITKDYRGCEVSTVLEFPGLANAEGPIIINTSQVKAELGERYHFDASKKLIVSMGANFKYKNIIGISFNHFVTELLSRLDEDVYFLIIGADPKEKKWEVMSQETEGKGKALGVLPLEEAEKLISCADLYVASFPMLAHGVSIAQKASIPSIALQLIERRSSLIGENCAKSIEELINQAIEVLSGEKQKYLEHYIYSGITQEEWISKWDSIWENNTRHINRMFKTIRCIENREYINCQLMQDDIVSNNNDLFNIEMESDVIHKIKQAETLYELRIFDERIQVQNARAREYELQKYKQLFGESMQWHQLRNEGKSISSYLTKREYKTAAIYGMGRLGENLAVELKDSPIELKYAIDKNAKNIHSDIKILLPTEELEVVDVIINTAKISIPKVRELTKCKKNIEIISLDQILNDMM